MKNDFIASASTIFRAIKWYHDRYHIAIGFAMAPGVYIGVLLYGQRAYARTVQP
jgi:hypothetical protein